MQQRHSVKSAAAQQRTRLKLKETAMDVRGYPTGPIDAKGAFTSEIDLPPTIKPGPLNTVAEADRPHIVDQPGMRHKYLPLRHDPATGAISSGGLDWRARRRARPSASSAGAGLIRCGLRCRRCSFDRQTANMDLNGINPPLHAWS
jgi:hypothetical protein